MIKFVTDSTSYLPADILQQYDITVVPLKVQFGAETYDEISGISNRDFYHRLTTTQDFPTTSQPSAGEFERAYQEILTRHPETEILVLTISSKLSGTYSSAVTAAERMPAATINVFDTNSAAMGLGLMVMTAAKMAASSQSKTEILSRLEQMRREMSIVLVVDTLEYLKRGGRIGAATAFLGTLLNTKPILAIADGEIQPLDRVRTKKKALKRLFTELDQKLDSPDQTIQAGIMHVAAEAETEELAEMMRNHFNISYLFISELGPVVGTHVGPGTLGVGICPEPD